MTDPSQFESLTQDQIDSINQDIFNIIKSVTKNEIASVQGLGVPPNFTFNILKLFSIIFDVGHASDGNTWAKIKEKLPHSIDLLDRKYRSLRLDEFEQEEIEILQKLYQQIFTRYGKNIEGLSELYGTFVNKVCKFCLKARVVIHGSKFLRCQD